ncbi:hypothetical protein [Saccharopolyspora dendranthemae]|nr:hypothetical protein [Saccharopolyspora dendranthemae]
METEDAGDGKWAQRRAARRAAAAEVPATLPSVEQIRVHKPRQSVVSLVLLITALLAWVPVAGYFVPAAGLLMVLCISAAIGVAKGRHAARVMVTIVLAVLYLLLLPYCWLGFTDPHPSGPAYALMDVYAVLASGTALLLMYLPATDSYIRRVTAARKAS